MTADLLVFLAVLALLLWWSADSHRRQADDYRERWTRLLYENGALKGRIIELTSKLDGPGAAMAALHQDEELFFFGDRDPVENRQRMGNTLSGGHGYASDKERLQGPAQYAEDLRQKEGHVCILRVY